MPRKNSRLRFLAPIVLCAAAIIGGIAWFAFHGGAPSKPSERTAPAQQATPHTPFGWVAQVSPFVGDAAAGMVDGAARTARFSDPYGVVVDHDGNLYVADAGENNRIRRIAVDGSVTTLAGATEGFADGVGAQASFNTPSGLAIDEAGNLYLADTGNNAIRKITPQGVVTTLAGDGSAGYRDGAARQARFNGPIAVAVDHHGNVYVADTYNDRIRMISAAGIVSTLAGGNSPGYRDGAAAQALFDTPCALALAANGDLLVADTRNNAIRTVNRAGQVGTLLRTAPEDRTALLKRPLNLALTADGFLYVGSAVGGRIFQVSPGGELRGLSGVDIDFASGDDSMLRLVQPSGIAIAADGALLVADADMHGVRRVAPRQSAAASVALPQIALAPAQPKFAWPVKPQHSPHEIVGTVGEVRGNNDGDSRDHFHAGVDVRADMGTPVLAVAAGKVGDALANWGYGDVSEGLCIDALCYIHMRVGRSEKNAVQADPRFAQVADLHGKPRMRVKRGTRFAVGDVLGTVNRMFHVHLEYVPNGSAVNSLGMGFEGMRDSIAPRIESIQLQDRNGAPLTKKRAGRLLVPADAGELAIVVGAYDQMDGNSARRRLDLYKVGYQILHANGDPLPGFEQPLCNLEFNRLPPDGDTVKIAYAEGSGETVHGNATTRFLYVVTNTVRDGHAKSDSWRPAALPRGDYLIRIFAADFAGNVATAGRDLAVTLE